MIVKGLHEHVEITHSEKLSLLPRIQLHPIRSYNSLQSIQTTIFDQNCVGYDSQKCSGLMLKHAGTHLPLPVLVHGQLYGTFSLSLFI
jgi:hypothetical protein